MNDPRFLTLLTLIKIKNYTQTAKKLFITQPAVTQHIKSLEKEYDVNIFEEGHNFVLTKQGELLVEYGRRMINHSSELSQAIKASFITKRTINVGISEGVLKALDSKLLNLLIKVYEAALNIQNLKNNQIFNDLREGKLDLAIVDCQFDDEQFEGIKINNYNIIPVCYKEGKFREIKRVTRDMIKNNPLILSAEDEAMCLNSKESLKKANVNLNRLNFNYADNIYVQSALIEAKDGIGFIYDGLIDLVPNLKQMELSNFSGSQNIYLIYSQNNFEKNNIKELKKILINMVN